VSLACISYMLPTQVTIITLRVSWKWYNIRMRKPPSSGTWETRGYLSVECHLRIPLLLEIITTTTTAAAATSMPPMPPLQLLQVLFATADRCLPVWQFTCTTAAWPLSPSLTCGALSCRSWSLRFLSLTRAFGCDVAMIVCMMM
jgi:hypothetical protein